MNCIKRYKNLFAALFAVCLSAVSAYGQEIGFPKGYFEEKQAYLMITGIRLNEDRENYVRDFSAGQDAIVRLTAPDGKTQEKKTTAFQFKDETYYTADFVVDFDQTYAIEMLFPGGEKVNIPDYRLSSSWKTHFLYHSTTGGKGPAAVFRKEKAPDTDLYCCVYGLFPYVFYKQMGGKL